MTNHILKQWQVDALFAGFGRRLRASEYFERNHGIEDPQLSYEAYIRFYEQWCTDALKVVYPQADDTELERIFRALRQAGLLSFLSLYPTKRQFPVKSQPHLKRPRPSPAPSRVPFFFSADAPRYVPVGQQSRPSVVVPLSVDIPVHVPVDQQSHHSVVAPLSTNVSDVIPAPLPQSNIIAPLSADSSDSVPASRQRQSSAVSQLSADASEFVPSPRSRQSSSESQLSAEAPEFIPKPPRRFQISGKKYAVPRDAYGRLRGLVRVRDAIARTRAGKGKAVVRVEIREPLFESTEDMLADHHDLWPLPRQPSPPDSITPPPSGSSSTSSDGFGQSCFLDSWVLYGSRPV